MLKLLEAHTGSGEKLWTHFYSNSKKNKTWHLRWYLFNYIEENQIVGTVWEQHLVESGASTNPEEEKEKYYISM